MAKAIERRLSGDGIHWETVVVDENGGGTSGLSMIGPFTVPFDDPGVNNTFTVLTPLAAGTTIIRVWAIDQDFETSAGDPVEVTVDVRDAEEAFLFEVYRVNSYNLATSSLPALELREEAEGTNDWVPKARVGRVPDDAVGWMLASYIFVNGASTPSAGAFDFYALADVPA